MDIFETISSRVKAMTPYIWVNTYEEDRFLSSLNLKVATKLSRNLFIWSSNMGVVDSSVLWGTRDTGAQVPKATGIFDGSSNPVRALEKILEYSTPSKKMGSIFVLLDFHPHITPPIARILRDAYFSLSKQKKCLLFVSPRVMHGPNPGLEPTLEKQIYVVDYKLPTRIELKDLLNNTLCEIKNGKAVQEAVKRGIKFETRLEYEDYEVEEFTRAIQGMTKLEASRAVTSSLTALKKIDSDFLLKEKQQAIKRSDVLEYIGKVPSFEEVGGLDQLKAFVEMYDDQFSDAAEEFGLEPLKGLLFVGVPGCGKSLSAKAIANKWKLPLLRLDIGRVMASLVGQSVRGTEEIIWYDGQQKAHRNTIQELVNLSPKKCWVHTYNDQGQACLRRVQGFIPHKLSKEEKLYRLTLENGRSVVLTGDHGVLSHTETLSLKEEKVSNLKSGDFLAMPGHLPNQLDRDMEETWIDGFLAGAWLGDGDYNGKDVRLHLHQDDEPSFLAILEETGLPFASYQDKDSKGRTIHIKGGLRQKLEDQGFIGHASTKRVPAFVFHCSDEYIKGLLCGYFSTNGSFSNHVIEASSVSKLLRDDIIHLLHRIGIHAFSIEKNRSTNFREEATTDYFIYISAETDLQVFENTISFIQDYKTKALDSRHRANPHGYYVPLTNQIKKELTAMRRRMWKKLHARPHHFNYQATSIGLETVKKCAQFALESWDANPNNEPVEHFGITLKNIQRQQVRWIKVKSIEEVSRLPGEEYVYDLSVPEAGAEKFIVGSCPILVHNSEERMRGALQAAEAIAPCVLWVDEIEKGLAGTGSSNNSDAGTLARVFGTLLTTMEEGLKGVVLIATANDISALPPELIRRFNEVLFVDLPTAQERKDIFCIHLKERKRSPKEVDLDSLVEESADFTGSEIEKAVKEAIARAWHNKSKLKTEHIVSSLKDTKPISTVMAENIQRLRDWAKERARYASSQVYETPTIGSILDELDES